MVAVVIAMTSVLLQLRVSLFSVILVQFGGKILTFGGKILTFGGKILTFGGKILTGSLDKLSAQLRIYHDFDEGISITFGIYIIHKLVCITCRYQFG